MTEIDLPSCCNICGHYLTTTEAYSGNRCTNPGHWQAAGLLASHDFYSMAQITALAREEQMNRSRPEAPSSGTDT